MTTGKELKATLGKIEGGELFDIFNLLPNVAGGEDWLAEIQDCARSMGEWLDDEKDYDLNDLLELGWHWANSECEDYYNNINARVQTLSLWASDEIDEEVNELNNWAKFPSLKTLNAQYLCTAMRILWDAVADQAYQNTGEGQ